MPTPERGKRPVFGPERPENARQHAVTTRSHSRGWPCNPWSKAKNSSFLMACGDARHFVPWGRRRSAALEGHFGPQIVLYSHKQATRDWLRLEPKGKQWDRSEEH